MRKITFNEVQGDYGVQLDIYVDGQLAAISVNEDMKDVISDLSALHNMDTEAEIAKLLMHEITEEFELSEEEQVQFTTDIEEKLRKEKYDNNLQ